ncbi:hypothetical protein Tco_0664023 [Tanacetum coccineum]
MTIGQSWQGMYQNRNSGKIRIPDSIICDREEDSRQIFGEHFRKLWVQIYSKALRIMPINLTCQSERTFKLSGHATVACVIDFAKAGIDKRAIAIGNKRADGVRGMVTELCSRISPWKKGS